MTPVLVLTQGTAMLWKVTLFVGLFALGIPAHLDKFVDVDRTMKVFTMSVEHVVFQFNEAQEDPFAYKFLRVWRSQGQVRGPRALWGHLCLVIRQVGIPSFEFGDCLK